MQITLKDMRRLFKHAPSSEAACNKLIEMCDHHGTATDAVVLGYKGSATIIMAKHAVDPFTKWLKFTSGRDMLEQAVLADSSNIELRYLRFTIQTNLPSFLGYNVNLHKDKAFLMNVVKRTQDMELKKLISEFFLQLQNNDKE